MSEMFDPEDEEQAQTVPLDGSELEAAAGGTCIDIPPFDPDD